MTEEEADCCPLCMEELDLTDKTFNACQCGYQVCLWCWHQIKNEYNGLCPACRTPYSEKAKLKSSVDREEVVRKTKLRKQKEKADRKTSTSTASTSNIQASRKSLANVRVVQKNLVYVIGLPLHFAVEEKLRKPECFGQYGKIIKVVVNKSYLSSDRTNTTAGAYVTFARKEDAQKTIDALDGYYLDGRLIRASFGTTKYCNFFLRNLSCSNPECLYLHELGEEDDSYTKEEMQAGKPSFREIPPPTHPNRSGPTFPPPPEKLDDQKPKALDASTISDHRYTDTNTQRKAQSAAAIDKLKHNSENMKISTDPILHPNSEPQYAPGLGKISPGSIGNRPMQAMNDTSTSRLAHIISESERSVNNGQSTWSRNNASNYFNPDPRRAYHPQVSWGIEQAPPEPLVRTCSDSKMPPPSTFASIDANFSTNIDQSEALANLLGVQLTGTLAAQHKKSSSRFAFANRNDDDHTSQLNGRSNDTHEESNSGLAFLQQMLPNVNISYGTSYPSHNTIPQSNYMERFQPVQDPVIVSQGNVYNEMENTQFNSRAAYQSPIGHDPFQQRHRN